MGKSGKAALWTIVVAASLVVSFFGWMIRIELDRWAEQRLLPDRLAAAAADHDLRFKKLEPPNENEGTTFASDDPGDLTLGSGAGSLRFSGGVAPMGDMIFQTTDSGWGVTGLRCGEEKCQAIRLRIVGGAVTCGCVP